MLDLKRFCCTSPPDEYWSGEHRPQGYSMLLPSWQPEEFIILSLGFFSEEMTM